MKGWGDSSAERFLGAEVRGRLKAKDKPPPLPDALYLYDFFTSSAMIRASRRLPGLPGASRRGAGKALPAAGKGLPAAGKAPSRPFPAAPRPRERLSRRGAALPLESERFLQLVGRAPSSPPKHSPTPPGSIHSTRGGSGGRSRRRGSRQRAAVAALAAAASASVDGRWRCGGVPCGTRPPGYRAGR